MDQGRRERIVGVMRERGVDALIVGPGADLVYLTGYEAMLNERLTALYLDTHSRAELVIPLLEAPRAQNAWANPKTWGESESPTDILAGFARESGASTIAVGDVLWSCFLLDLQRALPNIRWQKGSEIVGPARLIKDNTERGLLRKAGAIADEVWTEIPSQSLLGKTESEVSETISQMLLSKGLDRVDFAIVASGPNGASPHHHTGSRVLEEGDMVVLDYGGPFHGYFCDITRTLHLGKPTPSEVEVYDAVRKAQEAGVKAVRPGVAASEVDRAARSVLEEAGLGEYFIHRTGHGLGLEDHEPPYIRDDNPEVLREDMVFSIEPGAYIPGEFGVRIEDIVIVTADGCERLNNASRYLIRVM